MKTTPKRLVKSFRFQPSILQRMNEAVERSGGTITDSQIVNAAVSWYLNEMDRRGGFFVEFHSKSAAAQKPQSSRGAA